MSIRLSVVVPAYNEEQNMEPFHSELSDVLSQIGMSYEVIYIDDGSTDATFRRLSAIQNKDLHVKIVKLRRNFGQSAAMKAGFDTASGEYIVTLDADLQNDPHDIPKMLDTLVQEDYDVICGWRHNRKDKFLKKITSRIANCIRAILTSEMIHDSGCTLRVYKRECVRDLDLYGELHRYIPSMLQWKGYLIGEMKTNHRDRKFEQSKYNWKRLVKGFLDLLVVTFWQKYSARPMHIFGGSGIIICVVGGIIAGYLLFQRLFFAMPLSDRPLFQVSIMLVVIGIQFVGLGILADIMVKIYHSQNERKPYLIEQIYPRK